MTRELTELRFLSEEYVRGWSKTTTSLHQPRYLFIEHCVWVSYSTGVRLYNLIQETYQISWDFPYALYQDYLGSKLERQSALHRYTWAGGHFEHRVHSSWPAGAMDRACATHTRIKTTKKSFMRTAFRWDARLWWPQEKIQGPTQENAKCFRH